MATEFAVVAHQVHRQSAVSGAYVERIRLDCIDGSGHEATIWLYFEAVPRVYSKKAGFGIATGLAPSRGAGDTADAAIGTETPLAARYWVYRDPADFVTTSDLLESDVPGVVRCDHEPLPEAGPTASLITDFEIRKTATTASLEAAATEKPEMAAQTPG